MSRARWDDPLYIHPVKATVITLCGDYAEALRKVITEMGEEAFLKRVEKIRSELPVRCLPEFRVQSRWVENG